MKAAPGDTATAALRRKLWRRLLWKVPLIVLLVTFAVWWESRKQKRDGATDAGAAAFTGAWSGEVSYGDGARFNEHFFFQPENGKLFGSAAFRGLERGIEEGSVDGNRIAFYPLSGIFGGPRARAEALLLGGNDRSGNPDPHAG